MNNAASLSAAPAVLETRGNQRTDGTFPSHFARKHGRVSAFDIFFSSWAASDVCTTSEFYHVVKKEESLPLEKTRERATPRKARGVHDRADRPKRKRRNTQSMPPHREGSKINPHPLSPTVLECRFFPEVTRCASPFARPRFRSSPLSAFPRRSPHKANSISASTRKPLRSSPPTSTCTKIPSSPRR